MQRPTAANTKQRVPNQRLLPENRDMNLSMALSVMSYALIGSQASPLRKVLVDLGLGEDVNGGLSGSYRQMGFWRVCRTLPPWMRKQSRR